MTSRMSTKWPPARPHRGRLSPYGISIALIGHGWVHQWVAGYRDQGRVDLSVDIAVERLAIFTERALSGLAQR